MMIFFAEKALCRGFHYRIYRHGGMACIFSGDDWGEKGKPRRGSRSGRENGSGNFRWGMFLVACNRRLKKSPGYPRRFRAIPAARERIQHMRIMRKKAMSRRWKWTYDPAKITYERLLDVLLATDQPNGRQAGQFVDRGPQYRSAIFYLNDEQKRLAEKSKEELGKSRRYDKPIVTGILKASTFYPAEEYHQDYYKKNPIRYKYYRARSGRDDYLDKIWGKDRDVKPAVETKGAPPMANDKGATATPRL